ncbi:MAG: hypothetical protein JWN78_1437, partial [Bacteroidota bacterium]|nr:hypothetical protein [Bacteroidota bacterium]
MKNSFLISFVLLLSINCSFSKGICT